MHSWPARTQIYLQGLLINCPDEGVLYSRQLEEQVILEAIEFAEQHGLTLTGAPTGPPPVIVLVLPLFDALGGGSWVGSPSGWSSCVRICATLSYPTRAAG